MDWQDRPESPCTNGAVCTQPQGNMYSCVCKPGWAGTNCEKELDECASNPCYHGGTCSNPVGTPDAYTCSCDFGWQGDQCEHDIDECTTRKRKYTLGTCAGLTHTTPHHTTPNTQRGLFENKNKQTNPIFNSVCVT